MKERQYSGLVDGVLLETQPVVETGRGLHRLLGARLVGGFEGKVSFLGSSYQSQVSAGDALAISIPTLLVFCFCVFHVMIAVALSYATYVDGFMSSCGDIWNVVLAATICRFVFVMFSSGVSKYNDCPDICYCWIAPLYTLIAAAAITLCCLEGIFIHNALGNPECKKFMQDGAFRTPMLAEIGIVGLIIDCVCGVALPVIALIYLHYCCCGNCRSEYRGYYCCGCIW